MTDESREAEIRQIYRGLQGNMPPFGDILVLLRIIDDLRARLTAAEQERNRARAGVTNWQTAYDLLMVERDAALADGRRQGIEEAAASHERNGGNPVLRKIEADAIRALAAKEP